MTQLNGWLLYSKADYERNSAFAGRFLELGNGPRSSLKLVIKDDVYYGVKDNKLCVIDKKGSVLSIPDFVINRNIDPLFTRHLEAMGARVYNSGGISSICNDKARTYLEVSLLGIPMLDTLFVDKKTLLEGSIPIEYPAVLKTVEGRGGKEVFLVHSDKEAGRIAQETGKERFVIQRLCGSPGKDVRVFVVGKNIVGAIIRTAKADFKANLSLGGTVEAYELTGEQREIVMKIAEHFEFGMVGIDFVFNEKGGFLFNEIEDVAGSRSLSMTSNTDIVKLYLEYIYKDFDLSV